MWFIILFMKINVTKSTPGCSNFKAPITIAADDTFKYIYIYIYIFFLIFYRKCLNITCDLSAKQTIHMKCQYLFSLKTRKVSKGYECLA